jgi:hypothetical protein
MPLQVKEEMTSKEKKPKTTIEITNEVELSWLVFNVFQVAVLEYKFIKEQDTYYTRLFLQWTTSKILKKNWRCTKMSLVPEVQAFGDLLFDFAPKKNKHDPESYKEASEALQSCKEYKRIFCC